MFDLKGSIDKNMKAADKFDHKNTSQYTLRSIFIDGSDNYGKNDC
ncbi:hypothetical protein [Photobacterium kishitanii]|nr:hypothetical protein [Photobacterium kishitanii]